MGVDMDDDASNPSALRLYDRSWTVLVVSVRLSSVCFNFSPVSRSTWPAMRLKCTDMRRWWCRDLVNRDPPSQSMVKRDQWRLSKEDR